VSDAFHRLYSDIPRAGPGEPADVRWALDAAGTPDGARILDAGCGPGGDIATLLQHLGAQVTAVDSHPPFIEAIRARHPEATAFAGDMATAEGPFDFIWCAGALYFLGLASGLAAFRPRLAEDGAIAFSEPCLFTETPSPEAKAFWDDYPARTEARLRDDVEGAGYRIIATRRLSDAAWDAYYTPLLARAAALRPHADPDLLRVILAAEAEAALWSRVKGETGYLLVLARPA
jgi:SAM-dependent methyltransferase